MRNAVNDVQNIVLFGGTSDIGVACVKEFLRGRAEANVTLAARPSARRDACVQSLTELGAQVRVVDFDAEAPDGGVAAAREALTTGAQGQSGARGASDVDVVLVAQGILDDGDESWQQVERTLRQFDINTRSTIACGVVAAEVLRRQGHGNLVLISSVAGERVRRANFAYGASKAGADAFYLGLRDALEKNGVGVSVVRPGFVESSMTQGMEKAPLATTPERVAQDVTRAVARNQRIVWSPAPMRAVMSGLRHTPHEIFKRLPM